MEENKNKKPNFFKKLLMAIKDFDQYKEFAVENIGKVIKYLVLLMLLFSCIVSVGLTIRVNNWIGSAVNYIRNDMPDFRLENKELKVDSSEPIVIEDENSPLNIIIINTSDNEEEINENIEKISIFGTGALILKDRVLLKTSISNTTSDLWTYYGDMNISDLSKQELLDMYNTR